MTQKILLTLFTGYSISAFAYYYVSMQSFFLLWISVTAIAGVICFKFPEKLIGKYLINISTGIQISYLFIFLFVEKLQVKLPDGFHVHETLMILFSFIFLAMNNTGNQKLNLIFYKSAISIAMALSFILAIQRIHPYPAALYLFPFIAASCLLGFVVNKKLGLVFTLLNALISIGLSFMLPDNLNAVNQESYWTRGDIIIIDTGIVLILLTMFFAPSFFKERIYAPKYSLKNAMKKPVMKPKGMNPFVANLFKGNGRGRGFGSFNRTQSSQSGRKKFNPFGFGQMSNSSGTSSGTNPNTRSRYDDGPNYHGMREDEIIRAQEREFYGVGSHTREKIIREREHGLPAYKRTDDLLDD